MEITWYGHSCFRITERGLATVVTDPYDHRQVGYDPLKLKADIVTISHNSPGHNNLSAVKGNPYRITGPGEFEVGGVFITGIQTNGHKSPSEARNTLYLIEVNGITIVHLGDMDRVPTQTEVEALGNVNIALVPVSSGSGLNVAKAVEALLNQGARDVIVAATHGVLSGPATERLANCGAREVVFGSAV